MAINTKYPDWILERACPYRDSYISFLDILGFKQLVQDERNSHKIATPYYALQDMFASSDKDSSAGKMSLALISDTIVLSADASIPNIVENVVSLTSAIIREYWEEGIILRGAITFGKLFHDGNIVYGPALVDAYLMERDKAVFPRVIVSKDMFQKHIVGTGFQEQFVVDASDIHYFDFFGLFMSDFIPSEYRLDLAQGRKWLSERLLESKGEDRVYSKYEWLKSEWNKALTKNASKGIPPIDQYMIH